MFETCETSVLLDSVGPVHLSKRVIEMERKQDEKWDGGGCSGTCKAREKFNYKSSNNILFWRKFTLTLTRDLGFKFLVVDMALCWCCRSPCKFSSFTWFAIVFVHRPLPKR